MNRLLTNQITSGKLIGLLLFMAALQTAGCATYHDLSSFQFVQEAGKNEKPYILEPPDVISIKSGVVREIGNHSVRISPDGSVMLPLLGSIHVAGKTTEQVAAALQERARNFYEEADISVNVIEYRSKFVYVFGEVSLAGQYPYTGSNSVLKLLAAAQPTRAADRDRIQILRPTQDGEAVRITVKLSELVTEGDTSRNAILQDGDIIFVPANGFAEVGYLVQNLLRPVAPAAATVQGVTSIDSGQATLRASGGTP